jgi:hypothetical protein
MIRKRHAHLQRVSLNSQIGHLERRAWRLSQRLGIVALCLFWLCRYESEGGRDAGGAASMAAGSSDVGMPGGVEDSDAEVPQGGRDLRPAACADVGGVFAVGDFTDVMEGFDAPVAADPAGELARAWLVTAKQV